MNPNQTDTNGSCFQLFATQGRERRKGCLGSRLLADQALQHHHEAARLLAEGAVGVVLQEGEQLLSNLRQHRGHVVSCQRVVVVQIHHSVLQVAAQTDGKVLILASLF